MRNEPLTVRNIRLDRKGITRLEGRHELCQIRLVIGRDVRFIFQGAFKFLGNPLAMRNGARFLEVRRPIVGDTILVIRVFSLQEHLELVTGNIRRVPALAVSIVGFCIQVHVDGAVFLGEFFHLADNVVFSKDIATIRPHVHVHRGHVHQGNARPFSHIGILLQPVA